MKTHREEMLIFKSVYLIIMLASFFFPLLVVQSEGVGLGISAMAIFNVATNLTGLKQGIAILLFCYVILMLNVFVSLLAEILKLKKKNYKLAFGILNSIVLFVLTIIMIVFLVDKNFSLGWGFWFILLVAILNIVLYFCEFAKINSMIKPSTSQNKIDQTNIHQIEEVFTNEIGVVREAKIVQEKPMKCNKQDERRKFKSGFIGWFYRHVELFFLIFVFLVMSIAFVCVMLI